MSRRQQRVEDLLQREIADILLQEVTDPRLSSASVSRVHVSADLGHAQVLLSILGDEQPDEAALGPVAAFTRRRLAARLNHMKRVPQVTFRVDHGAEHSQHIDELLEQIKSESSTS